MLGSIKMIEGLGSPFVCSSAHSHQRCHLWDQILQNSMHAHLLHVAAGHKARDAVGDLHDEPRRARGLHDRLCRRALLARLAQPLPHQLLLQHLHHTGTYTKGFSMWDSLDQACKSLSHMHTHSPDADISAQPKRQCRKSPLFNGRPACPILLRSMQNSSAVFQAARLRPA